jgi:hypothetical protein
VSKILGKTPTGLAESFDITVLFSVKVQPEPRIIRTASFDNISDCNLILNPELSPSKANKEKEVLKYQMKMDRSFSVKK